MKRAAYPFLAIAALLAILYGRTFYLEGDKWFPLERGRWWLYDAERVVLDEQENFRVVVNNLGSYLDGSVRVFRQRWQNRRDLALTIEDGQVLRRTGSQLSIVVPKPQDQNTWQVSSHLGLVESKTFARQDRLRIRRIPITLEKRIAERAVNLSMPTGIFESCLLIEGIGITHVPTDRGNSRTEVTVTTQEWFAPGIGLVRYRRDETADSPFLISGREVWSLTEFGGD